MPASRKRPQPSATRRRGLRLGTVFGIEIRLDVSLILVFALIVGSLGAGTFATWHPEWSPVLRWSVALTAGLLFFASILLHELAHSVIAQGSGIPVPRITLFLLGGLAEMESEPDEPAQEFKIAIVGPLTSLLIGVVCSVLGASLVPDAFVEQAMADPAAAMAALGVLPTLLLWLGPVNLMLGVFNLVPGFPLDGGRVLRSAIWAISGDRVKATTWAAYGGQVVAYGLIGLGIWQFVAGRIDGLWLVFIGWFLNNAARSTHARMLLEHSMQGLRVEDLMRSTVESVAPEMPLRSFVGHVLARSDQGIWPVVDATGTLVGTLTVADVRSMDAPLDVERSVGDVARAVEATLSPGDEASAALQALAADGQGAMVVMDNGRLVGVLRSGDINRWLTVAELAA